MVRRAGFESNARIVAVSSTLMIAGHSAGATISHFTSLGIDLIPGSGPLAAVVPGAVDAWLLLLRDKGTQTLQEVLEPAILPAGD